MSRFSSAFAAAATAAAACFPLAAQAASPGHAAAQAATVAPAAAASEPASRIVLEDYPVPDSQAYRLLPNDPGVVTNGPIPDTPVNRARYGAPLSRAGKATAPAGD